MRLLKLALLVLLLLLLRKLLWCFRWLWCYYRGRETPDPIPFLPRRSGDLFDRHIQETGRDDEPAKREE